MQTAHARDDRGSRPSAAHANSPPSLNAHPRVAEGCSRADTRTAAAIANGAGCEMTDDWQPPHLSSVATPSFAITPPSSRFALHNAPALDTNMHSAEAETVVPAITPQPSPSYTAMLQDADRLMTKWCALFLDLLKTWDGTASTLTYGLQRLKIRAGVDNAAAAAAAAPGAAAESEDFQHLQRPLSKKAKLDQSTPVATTPLVSASITTQLSNHGNGSNKLQLTATTNSSSMHVDRAIGQGSTDVVVSNGVDGRQSSQTAACGEIPGANMLPTLFVQRNVTSFVGGASSAALAARVRQPRLARCRRAAAITLRASFLLDDIRSKSRLVVCVMGEAGAGKVSDTHTATPTHQTAPSSSTRHLHWCKHRDAPIADQWFSLLCSYRV